MECYTVPPPMVSPLILINKCNIMHPCPSSLLDQNLGTPNEEIDIQIKKKEKVGTIAT
jgi:hypothetical protein